ncbi:hypothetical protein AgCh_034906 [Apium graveolens]
MVHGSSGDEFAADLHVRAAPSTASWILRRCRGVAVVGFLQNNTGRGVGVPRRLRRESKNQLFGKMKMNMNAGWLHRFWERRTPGGSGCFTRVSAGPVEECSEDPLTRSACGTELVRSGSVWDYSFHELRGVRSLGVGLPGAVWS